MSSHSRRSVLGMLGAAACVGTGSVLVTGCTGGPATQRAGEEPKAAPPTGRIPELEPGGSFDRTVADLTARDQFAGNVIVAYRGEPVLAASYGMANHEQGTPHGPETIFNVGSLTKLMTAVAITQLVAAGEVRLGENLGAYLDGFAPEVADAVTVHDLLTHSSGLGNFRRDPEYAAGTAVWMTPEESVEGTMAVIRRERLAFPPGSSSRYSNSGFYVLGEIVASASGLTYWDYVRQHVFAPAGMTDSDFSTNERARTDPRFAHAYSDPGPDGQRTDLTARQGGLGIGGGAGGSDSTTADLLRFGRALQGNELLSPVYTQLLLSAKRPSGVGGMSTYGSMLAIINDHFRLGHVGGDEGITAGLNMYLDLDWIVVFTSNYRFTEQARPLVQQPDQLIAGQT